MPTVKGGLDPHMINLSKLKLICYIYFVSDDNVTL
jgi:hypothetical protein